MVDDPAAAPLGETVARLSEYVIGTGYGDLPGEIVETERWHLLDTLGCALYGSTRPWIGEVVRAFDAGGEVRPRGEPGWASLIGRSRSAPPRTAALINGTAVHALDYDDHTQDGGLHAGCTTVPPALAFAETADRAVSGEEFLAAVTIGDEVGIRSGYGIGIGSLRDGFHIAGWTGAFASAAATGKLRGLDPDRLGHALGIAGTQGCGLTGAHSSGADVKRFHMGKAGEAGYVAVALAAENFTGDRRIFEDRHGGIGRTMSDDFDVDGVVEALGEEYRIAEKLTLKTFPAIGMIHASVDAVRKIVEENPIDREEVERAVVGVTSVTKAHVGWEYEPAGVMAAQSNLAYAVASYLEDGEVGVGSYTEEAIRRPGVVERAGDVDVVVDEDLEAERPGSFGAAVELVTEDGERHSETVLAARGYPENPMSEAELLEKFRTQAGHVLDEDEVERVIEFVLNIEDRDDVTELLELLSPE